jgi:chemotaxis signal transduction protein
MDQDSVLTEAGPASAVQWLVVRCAGVRYGLRLGDARGLLAPRPFTRLPGSGPAVAGLIGVRSRVVTCFDLDVILAGEPARAGADHRILLLEQGETTLGLVVDAALAVARLEVGEPRHLRSGLAAGEAHWEGEPVLLLDTDTLWTRLLPAAGERG